MRTAVILISCITFIYISSFSINGTAKTISAIEDSLDTDRLKYMNQVLASIRGKEKMRADSVFKNLKVIKGESSISAEHLLWMMNWGWSKELGITCSYCHNVNNWASDSISAKNIARGMWNMRVRINQEILPAITGRDYQNDPAVSCITCHRGKPIPSEK
jgi:Photosynthetic reaction centre cytochrome C subunit